MGRQRPRGVASEPSKILFFKFAEHGSTVLAYHAVARAIKMVGSRNVYFLVFKENRFILDVMHLIPRENVITIRQKSLIDEGTRKPGCFGAFERRPLDHCYANSALVLVSQRSQPGYKN